MAKNKRNKLLNLFLLFFELFHNLINPFFLSEKTCKLIFL
ncbi:hypothetical protein BBUWI9123_F0029 (plasmid) [Borreliella burgdorferi WI91-23]|nr:hypothetical protein BBUWI9123_F0029 [Borreliella burgdorferi WI91-23]